MMEWEEVELKDVVTKLGDGLHGTPKYSEDGEYYFINGNNFREGQVVVDEKTRKVSIEEYQKYKKDLSSRTLFVSINGTLGNIAFYNGEKVVLGKSACYFNVSKNVSIDYIRYVLEGRYFKHYIDKFSSGTTIQNLSLKSMREFPFLLPPIDEQKEIAKTLSNLDQKIDLLRQQNETLEQMAQTLFKRWFVDFEFPNAQGQPYRSAGGEMVASELGEIPLGWEVGSLVDILKLIGGGTPKTSVDEYWNGEIPWYSVVDVPKGNDLYVINTQKKITNLGLKKSSTRLLREGTIIISARGTVGKLAIVGREMAMNQSCYGIQGKENFGDNFIFFQMKDVLQKLKKNVHGAVFDTITKSTFENIRVVISTQSILHEYEIVISSVMAKILNNVNEIQTLTKLRDTLLPKLMSGEIQVPTSIENKV
jgi:type I restriction enzyme S subunit